jgi:hypothetical protein
MLDIQGTCIWRYFPPSEKRIDYTALTYVLNDTIITVWLGGLNLLVRRRSSPPGCIFELLEPAAASLGPSPVFHGKDFNPIAITSGFRSILNAPHCEKKTLVD